MSESMVTIPLKEYEILKLIEKKLGERDFSIIDTGGYSRNIYTQSEAVKTMCEFINDPVKE